MMEGMTFIMHLHYDMTYYQIRLRLSPNSGKVGWSYHCFSGRQSKGLRGSPDSVLYQFFFVERESWISYPLLGS